MHACDALVQNAGGLTSLEAFAAGLPVVSYRCIPGHGRSNARALEEAGLAAWIRNRGDLGPALAGLLHGPTGQAQRARGTALQVSAPGPVPAIAARAGHRVTPPHHSSPARRPAGRRLALAAATAAATLALGVLAPLAHAFTDAPARFAAVTDYLDRDGR
jgi:hypothetical protein